MRARLCSSEPKLPTPKLSQTEQIESKLPQQNTALQLPIHSADTAMPENSPVQKSTIAMSTPPRRPAREIRVSERFSSG